MSSTRTHTGTIVTRMAPSPTGHLHVGTARTALYNFIFARQHGGTFILRSEDTDKERSSATYESEIVEGLQWLGIEWDAFYRQSERAGTYRTYLERALEQGSAYLSKEPGRHDASVEIEVVRLKNPNKEIAFDDVVRGEIVFDTTELGDFVIARSLDDPLYHFAVVVDDVEMGITHVIRGEDHISNTPRQILIQEMIHAPRPVYAHLPLLLGKDRAKLSKRHGTVQLQAYIDAGYLRDAMVNYLALLGWNPGTDQEIFTPEELMRTFDLSGIQKGGAIFDIEKLKWINREHLKSYDDAEFLEMAAKRLPERVQTLPQFSMDRLRKLLPTIRERISVAEEITEAAEAGEYDFAFAAPKPGSALLKWKEDMTPKDAHSRLERCAEIIATIPEESTPENIRSYLWDYAEEAGRGAVLWPLRVALTGRERSPDPSTVIHIIGSAEAYKRVQNACDTIVHEA